MKKGIIREILDNHRDLAMYKLVLTDIALLLRNGTPLRHRCIDSMPNLYYIEDKINELRSRLAELEPSKDQG